MYIWDFPKSLGEFNFVGIGKLFTHFCVCTKLSDTNVYRMETQSCVFTHTLSSHTHMHCIGMMMHLVGVYSQFCLFTWFSWKSLREGDLLIVRAFGNQRMEKMGCF